MNDELVLEANRLYWESQKSVNQIADELDLSKGALYGAIEPLASDQGCPRCGAVLGYANRTARDRGELACAGCGFGADQQGGGAASAPASATRQATGDRASARMPEASAQQGAGARVLVGGAALCLGIGLLLGRMLPRR